MYLGLISFLLLPRGIGPWVYHIISIAAPGDDALSSSGAWVLKGFLGRGGKAWG